MVEPPVLAGAVQVTVLLPFSLEVPATEVGAHGTVEGRAVSLVIEATLLPFTFLAVTVKV